MFNAEKIADHIRKKLSELAKIDDLANGGRFFDDFQSSDDLKDEGLIIKELYDQVLPKKVIPLWEQELNLLCDISLQLIYKKYLKLESLFNSIWEDVLPELNAYLATPKFGDADPAQEEVEHTNKLEFSWIHNKKPFMFNGFLLKIISCLPKVILPNPKKERRELTKQEAATYLTIAVFTRLFAKIFEIIIQLPPDEKIRQHQGILTKADIELIQEQLTQHLLVENAGTYFSGLAVDNLSEKQLPFNNHFFLEVTTCFGLKTGVDLLIKGLNDATEKGHLNRFYQLWKNIPTKVKKTYPSLGETYSENIKKHVTILDGYLKKEQLEELGIGLKSIPSEVQAKNSNFSKIKQNLASLLKEKEAHFIKELTEYLYDADETAGTENEAKFKKKIRGLIVNYAIETLRSILKTLITKKQIKRIHTILDLIAAQIRQQNFSDEKFESVITKTVNENKQLYIELLTQKDLSPSPDEKQKNAFTGIIKRLIDYSALNIIEEALKTLLNQGLFHHLRFALEAIPHTIKQETTKNIRFFVALEQIINPQQNVNAAGKPFLMKELKRFVSKHELSTPTFTSKQLLEQIESLSKKSPNTDQNDEEYRPDTILHTGSEKIFHKYKIPSERSLRRSHSAYDSATEEKNTKWTLFSILRKEENRQPEGKSKQLLNIAPKKNQIR